MRSRVLAAAVAAAAARVRETERLMRRTLRHRIAAHADWVKLTHQGCMHRCRRHVDTQSTDADGAQRHVHRSVRTNGTLNVVALGLVMYCE